MKTHRSVRRLARPRLFTAAAPAALLLCASTAGAAPLVYEPFDYDAGTVMGAGGSSSPTATGTNLAGSYTSNSPPGGDLYRLRIASPGLTYGSLSGAPAVSGNRLTQDGGVTEGRANVSVDQDVLTGAGTTHYFSALVTFGNANANITLVDADTGDLVRFGGAGVGNLAIRIEADTNATGGLIAVGADNSFTVGQTLLLIGRYVNGAAAGTDSLHLLGYDTADAVALPADFTPADPNAQFSYQLVSRTIDLAAISRIEFAIRADETNSIDELRIGSSYADIIPEPTAALPLLALAGTAVGFRRPTRRARPAAGRIRP